MIMLMFMFYVATLSRLKIQIDLQDSVAKHGSLQFYRTTNILDSGDAEKWSSIKSDHRMTLDHTPGGHPSTVNAHVTRPLLGPNHQSVQDQH